TALGLGDRRNSPYLVARSRLYVRLPRCALPPKELARSDGALRGVQLCHRRAFGLPADSWPHHTAALGRAPPRTTWRSLQNQDGCRRNGVVPAADRVHVYCQLLPHQSKLARSEERRVGKECRERWLRESKKRKTV